MANELRERVILRVDGGMRSGRDVLVASALGGDEFGFGTVAMIATGCIMARVCHTNNCPVGVASQREELRARFPGAPGDLVCFNIGLLASCGCYMSAASTELWCTRFRALSARGSNRAAAEHADCRWIEDQAEGNLDTLRSYKV